MPCEHYPKGGSNFCIICTRNKLLDLLEQQKKLKRQINELIIKLGEEPVD